MGSEPILDIPRFPSIFDDVPDRQRALLETQTMVIKDEHPLPGPPRPLPQTCSGCRFYSEERCHLNPPVRLFKSTRSARPTVAAEDPGCRYWSRGYER